MPDIPAAPAAPPDVKPGWKTTELYVAVLTLGGLGWALQEVVRMLPSIAATPGLPGWVAPLLAVAPVGLGWLMKLVSGEYSALRTQLKLGGGAVTDSAGAAGVFNALPKP